MNERACSAKSGRVPGTTLSAAAGFTGSLFFGLRFIFSLLWLN
jgi:hypothetical protein